MIFSLPRRACAALLFFVFIAVLPPAGPATAAPRVVASFKPLQSLAAAVMAGIATPASIIHGAGSPHTYSLRPSDARELSRADVVFWIGPDFETFLTKPLQALSSSAHVVTLIKAAGVQVLAARHGGSWEQDPDEPLGSRSLDEADPHVFLDPRNAEAMVRDMAATLATVDPTNAARYRANAGAEITRLEALDAELARTLTPIRGRPFVVFHDGTQYLEHRYGLTAVGSIVVSPERLPGAKRIAEIHDKVESQRAVCVFAEPQFQSALVQTVVDGTKARTGVLDYVGVDLKQGPDAYFEMMRGLARALVGCLKA